MKNTNSDFVSTEIDLDRDVPNSIPDPVPNDMGWDVDVDEDGPFITASFDDYCDAHPDFNAALNGHWEYI